MSQDDFYYSPRYEDDYFEYRHVHVPKDVTEKLPKSRLLSEPEWRALGVQQSVGWVHYLVHGPERHIMLFRRPKPGIDPEVAAEIARLREAGEGLSEIPVSSDNSAEAFDDDDKMEEDHPDKQKEDNNDESKDSTESSKGIESMRIH